MARIIEGVSYLPTHEAAALMTTTVMRVLMLMREKAVAGIHIEGEWLVTQDSVAAWLAEGSEVSITKGCARSCASGHGCGCSRPSGARYGE